MTPSQKLDKKAEIKAGQHTVSTKVGMPVTPEKTLSKVPKVSIDTDVEVWHSGSYLGAIPIITDKTSKAEWKMTPVEKMDMVRGGLTKIDLEHLKNKTNLDYDKLSTLLSTARATLINKKGTAHFSAALSEKIVSIADVYSFGFEVFEDEAKFNEWVFKPNRALGGKQPFELLDNQFGREEVKNLIGRIDYGVYS